MRKLGQPFTEESYGDAWDKDNQTAITLFESGGKIILEYTYVPKALSNLKYQEKCMAEQEKLEAKKYKDDLLW